MGVRVREGTHGSCVGRCGFGYGDARQGRISGSSLRLGWQMKRKHC